MNRRDFLRGASAAAAAAAMPAPVTAKLLVHRPIFQGAIGTYQGVVIREVASLRGWMAGRSASPLMGDDLLEMAKRFAVDCHPGIRPYGFVTSTVLEGVEADGG